MEPKRIELKDALEGRHILVGRVTMATLASVQSGDANRMIPAVAKVVAGGDLPYGTDESGLGELTPDEFSAVCAGVAESTRLGK